MSLVTNDIPGDLNEIDSHDILNGVKFLCTYVVKCLLDIVFNALQVT